MALHQPAGTALQKSPRARAAATVAAAGACVRACVRACVLTAINLLQGFFSKPCRHVNYGGYDKPAPQTMWNELLPGVPSTPALCGDERLVLNEAQLTELVQGTVATPQRLPKKLTCVKFEHQIGKSMPGRVSYVDTYALPLHHAFLLGVVKTFLAHFAAEKVTWNGREHSVKVLMRLYAVRVEWMEVPTDFGRQPAALVSGDGGTLFPHWTCEDWLHFVETFSLLGFQ
jgi:hypothetical protein